MELRSLLHTCNQPREPGLPASSRRQAWGAGLQHRPRWSSEPFIPRATPFASGRIVGLVPRFRLEFVDDGSEVDVDADDFDDDGEWISLYQFLPDGADPMAPGTTKDVVASFDRRSLVGPPRRIG